MWPKRGSRMPTARDEFYETEGGTLVAEAGLEEWPYLLAFTRGRIDGSIADMRKLAKGYKAARGVGELRMERLAQALEVWDEENGTD
jgi:hypothetical protein